MMSSVQKIAFLCHPYHRGGVTRWMADAALAYDKQGLEVYFVTVDPVKEFHSAKGRETLLQLLGKEKNTVHIIKSQAGSEFEFGTPEYRSYIYRRLIMQLPPGTPIILSDDSTIWGSATYLHDTYPIIGVLHADEDHYYELAEKYKTSVNAFVCVSQRVHTTVMERSKAIDPAQISTIPCGIELPKFVPHGHDGDLLQLVYVGRVSAYQKRTGDLIKIAASLAAEGVPFHLHIIGNGEARPALEQAVKEAELEQQQQQVTFAGWLSQHEVAEHLSMSDMLVLTSDFEGTPIAMMEALAAGCGIVGTRVSGIEDYEVHPLASDCFSVFPVGNIPVAVQNIKKISAIPTDTRRQAARQLAEAEFSMEVCLERYMRVVHGIKHEPRPLAPITLSFSKLIYSRAVATARGLKVSLGK